MESPSEHIVYCCEHSDIMASDVFSVRWFWSQYVNQADLLMETLGALNLFPFIWGKKRKKKYFWTNTLRLLVFIRMCIHPAGMEWTVVEWQQRNNNLKIMLMGNIIGSLTSGKIIFQLIPFFCQITNNVNKYEKWEENDTGKCVYGERTHHLCTAVTIVRHHTATPSH